MKMIKFSLAVILIVFGTNLIAQPGGGNFDPEERMKRQTERLVAELGLSEDQAKQVETINREQMEKMMKAREEAMGDRESMREMRQQANADREAKYKEIFTDEQWTKFEQLKAENQDRRGPDGKKPGGKKGKKKKKKDSDS